MTRSELSMTEHRSGLYSAPGIHTTTQSYYIRSFWKSNFFMPSARFCQSQCRGLNGNQFRVWILRNLLQLRYYSFPSLFHVHCSPYARGLGAACPYFRACTLLYMCMTRTPRASSRHSLQPASILRPCIPSPTAIVSLGHWFA